MDKVGIIYLCFILGFLGLVLAIFEKCTQHKKKAKRYKRLIYAIDFDGIVVVHKFPFIGRDKKIAQWGIRKLKKFGHITILWTCRNGNHAADAFEYCRIYKIPFDLINSNCETTIKTFPNESRKILANYYIDDRNPFWFDLLWIPIVIGAWWISKVGKK